MIVADVMTTDPVTVTPETGVKQAIELLARHQVTSLPVVSRSRICGIVSEADLIRDLVATDARVAPPPDAGLDRQIRPISVSDVMTAHVVTVRRDTELRVAVELMTSTTVKSVVVIDAHDHVIGMLSRSDVVEHYARSDRDLTRAVNEALTSVDLGDCLVEVSEGVVHIGAPNDVRDSTLARLMAASVPGVIDVEMD